MKCPKCGYISFDYNLSCPKCNKDISAEQEKLHIPSFRPDAPYLLGSLIGEANESQATPLSTGAQVSLEEEADITLDEGSPIDSSELNMDSGELSWMTHRVCPSIQERRRLRPKPCKSQKPKRPSRAQGVQIGA